ncbi:SDR family oxidoreductase [Halieaceae bacterium IMCC14734]|uniref:SDR family oxidoreductase n=1 Tax=Candidatus Litorirhabdus singularis TaxID=2518993 RepID=A0ABT3TLF9_9GAMM|nr:SDR family oxidoreductase [Candidatus Litorirhabdus singularis]MCX2982834.1 SDR family oxidoreductase [Candidatus Litorirhabdus singularis]
MRLANKFALITGGASGLGAAAAARFIEEGCAVCICDIQDGPGEAFAATFGDKAFYQHCNVTIEDEVAGAIDAAVERFGRLDVVFHSAGIVGAVGPIATTPGDEWRFSMDVLLNGTFYALKHASRVMGPQGSGSIICMASTAGLMGGLGPHAYAAAKHGVVGLTKNVAVELASKGVRVNAIAAASMATPMVASVITGDPSDLAGAREKLAEASPLHGRAGLPEDVANAALFLASDEAGYTTGHTFTTDAGFTIGATVEGPAFAEYEPIVREAGKSGLDA